MSFVRKPASAVGSVSAALLVVGSVWPTSAGAGDPCSYDSATHTVNAGQPTDDETLTIIRNGDAIEVEGSNCGDATVSNTDRIVIDATTAKVQVNIHLGQGLFRPGFSEEPGDSDEVEFDIDLDDDDLLRINLGDADLNMRVGGGEATEPETRVNFNAEEGEAGEEGVDADLVVDRLTESIIGSGSAEGGGVEIDGSGGLGTGQAFPWGLYIVGGFGDDRIVGGDGPDIVYGGLGDDYIWGMSGRDRLRGAVGNESMWGGPDRDFLRGNRGVDHIFGLGGPDLIIGGGARDPLSGGTGEDLIKGQGGGDVLEGEKRDDELYGGDDNDSLKGGDGSDLCDGGEGTSYYKTCEIES
jgi:Ca2+-binding RTX toxin-like protein